MSQVEHYDAAVIGAGPAGSSIAAALAQRGWHVALLERDHLPRHKVCGEYLSAEAQHSLQQVGLLRSLISQGPVPLHGASMQYGGQAPLHIGLPGTAWGVSRWAMDAALAHGATEHGTDLRLGTTVTHFEQQADQVDVYYRGPDGPARLEARAVIAAGGRQAGRRLPPAADQRTAFGWGRCLGLKRHYTGVDMPNRVELYLFQGGYVGINPVERGRVNVCMLIQQQAFERLGGSVEAAFALACQGTPLADLLNAAQPVEGTLCTVSGVDTLRPGHPWQQNAACLGDAASMIPPLAGDGMAMALRSAELCAPLADAFLRGQISRQAWAERYSVHWQAEFNARLRTARLIQGLLAWPAARDALLWLGRQAPGLASRFGKATRGTYHPA